MHFPKCQTFVFEMAAHCHHLDSGEKSLSNISSPPPPFETTVFVVWSTETDPLKV